MDEDEFRKWFSKWSVFRQASSLDLSYVPDKIYCRDDTLKTLIFSLRRVLEEEEQPSINCLLLGNSGVGKTITAKFFGKLFRRNALENDVKVFIEYFNCSTFPSKRNIVQGLIKYIRGIHEEKIILSDVEVLKLTLLQLIREKGYMLLIIDEVHLLRPDEIFALLSIAETFGHQNAKLSILMISNSKDWNMVENEDILSMVNEKTFLKPYNLEEAIKILRNRSEVAFKEDMIDNEIITYIAKVVTKHKNMTDGIKILRKCGVFMDKEYPSWMKKDNNRLINLITSIDNLITNDHERRRI